MKYFYDCEFIEKGPDYPIELISIGIVAMDDKTGNTKEYYAVSSEFNPNNANDWVKKNVISKLQTPKEGTKSRQQIAQEIIRFVGDDPKPIFYGYYADYDHVVLCQLFGTMMDLPKNFPMYTRDIKQMADEVGNPELPKQDENAEHNALEDAKWNANAYKFILKYKFTQKPFNLREYKKILKENPNEKT